MDTTANSATGSTDANASPNANTTSLPARPSREPSSASTIKGDIYSPPSQPATQTSTSTSSPLPSRESSPNRPLIRSGVPKPSSTAGSTRSRNSSSQDTSPTRTPTKQTPPNAPTSAKISATTTPNLGPVHTDATVSAAAPHKSPVTAEHLKEGPRWPVSPRLRSPPPAAVLNRPNLPPPRKGDPEPPSIHVQHSSPPLAQPLESSQSDNDGEEIHLQPGMRTPARGASGSTTTLETVQEASPLATPHDDEVASEKVDDVTASEAGSQADHLEFAALKTARSSVAASNHDSGSDSGSVKGTRRMASTSVPPPMPSRQSSLSNKKTKPSEGSLQHMTVETETVTSIPQHSLAPVAMKEGTNGSLRTKPSSETIRPKKEKKKTNRKQPNVGSGTGETLYLSSAIHAPRLRHHQSMRSVSSMTDALISPTKLCAQSTYDDDVVEKSEATSPRRFSSPNARNYSLNNMSGLLTKSRVASSKADIFEAKIASAVDEADTSDSDETFVYDSNPPETNDRPRRFHSRTPSATSMASQVDRNGLRAYNSILENPGSSAGVKRSMKFVNSYTSSGNEMVIADEEGKGSARSNAGSARGAGRVHHHHFGRWGRSGANGHTSLFDNEAPFHISNTTAQRSKFSTNSSRVSSGPPSPRFLNAGRLSANGKRGMHSASYDLDDNGGADDERTPLIHGSVRSSRSGRTRRGQPVSLQSLESQNYRRNPSVLNRFASCLVLTVMLLLVVSGAIGFMFATSQPLMDVQLTAIKSVVAAEQELIFDITVKAYNPNVVIITVDQADIEVFAKSPHAGTDFEWWHRPKEHEDEPWDSGDGEMHTTEENEGPVDDKAPNMRLGTISKLDNALSFEGSFFNSGMSESSGEVKLRAPGNGTAGGSERWERILQDEFDLIIKGVLKYSLPLSQRVRSTTISGRTTVKPNAANDPTGNGTEPITNPKAPE